MVDKTWGRDENVKNFEREGDVAKTSEKSLREDKNVTGAVGTSDKAVSGTIRKSDKSLKEDRNLTKSRSKDVAPKKTDIPPKPKITLKSSKDRVPHFGAESNNKPVQYYDHPNRFSKQYIPSSHIEKIDEENLVVSPNVMSEDEVLEKMRQRDIEAHIRGQVALEKEKIQREYRELLKKLPALQKQERIAEIGMDKEKYHMTKERLEEMEKKRQNRLDNAYEELFVRRKPATVTLPRRKESEEVAPSLNLATWDVDFEPADSRPDTETSNKSRTEQLSHLLSNLKAQKDSLLKEIENTLSKDTLTQLTKSSYDDIKSKSTDYTQSKTKRKRSRDERAPSPSSSEINFEEESEVKTKSSKRGKDTTSVTTTGSPSPRKKAKKSKTKVLVLQNTSTQTTPKPGQSAATSPLTVPATERTEQEPCVCHKEAEDDLCEIVIKIKEDEKPEVIVNPPMMGKSVKVITEEKKMEQTQDNIQDSSREDSRRSKKSSSSTKTVQKASSWREQLSRSGSSQSTSSTSYFEPPSKSVGVLKKLGKSPEIEEISRSMDNTASSGGGGKIIDPRLLTYIKKLLNMSRASIDELTVSATSEVSTPSPSVVETPTNNPLLQLLNVMKYFNLDFADLQKQINFFSDESSVHYNTAESVTVSSSSNTSEGGRSVQFQSCTELDVNVVKSDTKGEDLGKKLIQYADIAASCTKKISNLTAMIEKVRAEKKKILQSPPTTSSDGEKDMSTTSYLALPGTSVDKEKDSSATSSPKQDDLDANLLTIDYSYAERLKQLTSEEIEIEKKRTESENPSDGELLAKLKKLVQEGDGKTVGVISQKTTVTQTKPTTEKNKKDLSPFFLDIPKLPRLEAPSLEKKKKRPPPSKGLKALGGPVPHELSTIIEADSQLSTKMESSIRVTSPKSSSGSKSSSVPDILTEVQHKEIKSQSTTNSSDDVSEMETMETMLISIGMEWAIPTLKKTREALALTSSSSSSGSKKDSGEVSLREFLSKISSSSSTPGSTLSDSQSQGMSLIQVDNRRTSTPILDNLNEVKKDGGPIFLTDSDISSVREQSDGTKEKFYDLNDGSISKTG
ncbi:hypothetical protein BDFB_007957 [Asbolus verrucosus]|uniref:Uncharacterized protein n=1 Tax=Asbolus verrucosus TaxID=1661398 RepID=A0A482VBI6_ASBVE|nr:hypothetical protein BDFB_007957 [Asbolus verrucosus]